MSNAKPKSAAWREEVYKKANGCDRLTIVQQRRIRKEQRKADRRSQERTRKRLLKSKKAS